jgi:hypothetical protein
VLSRIDDARLAQMIDRMNQGDSAPHLYLAIRLNAAALKTEEFSTDLQQAAEFLRRCYGAVSIEDMRRKGWIQATLPPTIRDPGPASITVLPEGRKRFDELNEQMRREAI